MLLALVPYVKQNVKTLFEMSFRLKMVTSNHLPRFSRLVACDFLV